MIKTITVKDNNKAPLSYISKLDSFANGKVYNFKPGINIIIGENGCGKTTLLKLISYYCLCNNSSYSKIPLDIFYLHELFMNDFGEHNTELRDGVKVQCDYCGVVYNYIVSQEMSKENIMDNVKNFSLYMNNTEASTGESMLNSFDSLIDTAFNNKNIQFPIQELIQKSKQCNDLWAKRLNNLINYYKENQLHITADEFEYTFIIDEPDRNLDVLNIETIYKILSCQKKNTQIICVIHNPILIYKLSKLSYVNFVEMTDGYLDKVKSVFNNL